MSPPSSQISNSGSYGQCESAGGAISRAENIPDYSSTSWAVAATGGAPHPGRRQSRRRVRLKRTTSRSFGVRRLAAALFPRACLRRWAQTARPASWPAGKRRQAAALQSCAVDFDATMAPHRSLNNRPAVGGRPAVPSVSTRHHKGRASPTPYGARVQKATNEPGMLMKIKDGSLENPQPSIKQRRSAVTAWSRHRTPLGRGLCDSHRCRGGPRGRPLVPGTHKGCPYVIGGRPYVLGWRRRAFQGLRLWRIGPLLSAGSAAA